VLQDLPKGFAAAIVIIQHVDQRFAAGMASWLAQHTQLPVKLVNDGDVLTPGVVYVPRTSDHLVLKNPEQLGYSHAPQDCVYRPSIDVFFKQVSQHWTGQVVGVLLTGMGRDGAAGLKALRDKGHHTIAQNRASSLVYGMPKAAAELGAAVDILPLDRIAAKLQDALAGRI
jgi:chemotaxis response regulator CheB